MGCAQSAYAPRRQSRPDRPTPPPYAPVKPHPPHATAVAPAQRRSYVDEGGAAMDATAVFSGAADGPFERVIHHLVVWGGLEVEGLGHDALLGGFPDATWRVLVLRYGENTAENAARLLQAVRAPGVEVVLVGGPSEAGVELAEALPSFGGPRVSAWHVSEDAEVRNVLGGGKGDRVATIVTPAFAAGLAPLLAPDSPARRARMLAPSADTNAAEAPLPDSDAPEAPRDAPLDWGRFWELVGARGRAAARELQGFQQALRGREPWATRVLLGVIVAVYVAGMTWGAPELTPALMRMGAFERERVLAGEVWRLWSAAFLHGNLLHIGFNCMVLWSLGSNLERLLGPARFLALWALGAFGGSLLCLVTSDGMAVGASGAGWALMAAEAALVWRGGGILPDTLRARMRQGTVQNLLLNVAISFAPGVAWAAHLGGGLVGAGLVFTGVLTWGVPRWAEGSTDPYRVPVPMRAAGVVSAVVLAASVVAALAVGKPWALGAPARLERAAVGATGWSAEVPAGLSAPSEQENGAMFGDLLEDAGAVEVRVAPADAAAAGVPPNEVAAGIDAAADSYEAELESGEAGYDRVGPVRRERVGDRVVVEAIYDGPGNANLVRAAVVGPAGLVQADAVYWSGVAEGWDTVAREVALSARPAP